MPLGALSPKSVLQTVVDVNFNGADNSTTASDSTGLHTVSGLGVVSISSFAYILSDKLFARNNYTLIDDGGSLSPFLSFEDEFEIEVAVSFNEWFYDYGETIWQLQDASGGVLTLYAFVDGHIELAANPSVLVGGALLSVAAGVNLSAQQVFKVARIGSVLSVYVNNVLKGTAVSTGTVNAGRFKFWTSNFERYVDYVKIRNAI
ncbi:MAG: hypothetical protein Q7U16_03775 [Agitococcus sp.]|nr:hypothetical protein [Agitococcus sp.]